MDHLELLTERELAARLKCSVPALRLWRRQGMPTRYLGRLVRFQFDQVLAWHEQRSVSVSEKHTA